MRKLTWAAAVALISSVAVAGPYDNELPASPAPAAVLPAPIQGVQSSRGCGSARSGELVFFRSDAAGRAFPGSALYGEMAGPHPQGGCRVRVQNADWRVSDAQIFIRRTRGGGGLGLNMSHDDNSVGDVAVDDEIYVAGHGVGVVTHIFDNTHTGSRDPDEIVARITLRVGRGRDLHVRTRTRNEGFYLRPRSGQVRVGELSMGEGSVVSDGTQWGRVEKVFENKMAVLIVPGPTPRRALVDLSGFRPSVTAIADLTRYQGIEDGAFFGNAIELGVGRSPFVQLRGERSQPAESLSVLYLFALERSAMAAVRYNTNPPTIRLHNLTELQAAR